MRLLISTGAVVAALSLTLGAQDNTSKSSTKVKADDAKAVSMTGCLEQDAATGNYTLAGTIAAAGDDLTSKTKVKTDVDDNDAKVKATTKASGGGSAATGSSGARATYTLVPRGVDLAPHVGHLVQVSALAVKPGHGDADVTIKDTSSVEPEGAPGSTERSNTKVEVPRSGSGEYTVIAVKHLSATCPAQ